ncbi:Predicted arabinose efflux permease, MFS family [Salinibacillus kushneri]|uniref:Predicted arabinose efflux permease, MFS family n=1 Tax=Salinibacillus kushneri TaxID=237682 RepID=A0A1I0DXW9_9BACI|nr:MFS transporter [Salinibacillus kushneri]SET37551.1 Predicted arabinose efflux permease, MFS family [Salinibacillus kushneri]
MTKQTYILTFLIFILSTGGYTAMPLFPMLTDIHSINLTQVSTLTATYIFTQKVTPILFGPLGDFYGYKRIAILGEMIRGIGFIGVGCVSNYYSLLICSAFAGLGGGFAVPSLQSLIMKSSKYEDRAKVSSLRASATNAGLLFGPILSGIVIWAGNLDFVFIFAGILYLLGSLLIVVCIDSYKNISEIKRISLQHLTEILHNKGFIHLMIFMLMFYILFAQLFVTLPDYAKQFTNQIQILFLINGITGLALQYPAGLCVTKYNKPGFFIILGITMIFLSFLTLSLLHNYMVLFISIIFFTIGEILILPIMETSIANYSDRSGNMGLYFGISKLSDGVGRPLGSILGGWMLYSVNPAFAWFIFSLFTIIILLYYLVFLKRV